MRHNPPVPARPLPPVRLTLPASVPRRWPGEIFPPRMPGLGAGTLSDQPDMAPETRTNIR